MVRLYWPADLRPAFDALFDIDEAMADVVVQSTQPALAAIKLAWWRARLEELDQGKVPAEPRLQAAAAELLQRGISGSDLARLEAGWAALLEDPPEIVPFDESGIFLFRLGARLLGVELDERVSAVAGRTFRGVHAARRGIEGKTIGRACPGSFKIPSRARPLTALAALASRDLEHGGPPFEAEATPGRAWAVLRHRLTGRLPR